MRNHIFLFLIAILFVCAFKIEGQEQKPVRLAVAGTSHGHLSFILDRSDKGGFELAGVFESDEELAQLVAERFELSGDLFYSDLENMLDEVKPAAVVAFGSIFSHLEVVEACAPRGIHVMVEKPLAVNMSHASRMADLAREHGIHLLTNYETSWYSTTMKTLQMVREDNFTGLLRKTVFHHGHQGPVEIGVGKHFLDWLTDPVLNGGGAIVDFGCYGANIMTALTHGEKPVSVTAVTRQFKPEIYPEVDDEATIIVSYPESQAIIQASWNWPFNRKDMEIYGVDGSIKVDNDHDMRVRSNDMRKEEQQHVTSGDVSVYDDPFAYFFDVIKGNIDIEPFGLYSLENNMRVIEILDAARKSAEGGETIYFEQCE